MYAEPAEEVNKIVDGDDAAQHLHEKQQGRHGEELVGGPLRRGRLEVGDLFGGQQVFTRWLEKFVGELVVLPDVVHSMTGEVGVLPAAGSNGQLWV